MHAGRREGECKVRTESNISPRWWSSDLARVCCCFGAQCISSDKMTGTLVVMNAQSQIAAATLSKASTVQKV